MAKTQVRGPQILDGSVQRADLDDGIASGITGVAVVRKIVQGTGITLSSTGFDSGTGDVTINASGGGGNVNNVLTPLVDQLAVWTDATHIKGIMALPAANFPALTGDVTTTAGSLTTAIGASKVTLGMLANIAADSIMGNTSLAAGTPAAITALPFAYTGDVTRAADSNATVLAAGNAGNLNSGTLLAARMPALTGDITTSAGAVATTYNNAVPTTKAGLPTGGTAAQVLSKIDATNFNTQWVTQAGGGNVSNSGTPVANQLAGWTDATHIRGVPEITYDGTNTVFDVSAAASTKIRIKPNGATGAGFIQNTATSMLLSQNGYYDGTNWKYDITAPISILSLVGGDAVISLAPSGTAGNNATLITGLRIFNTGGVGFGGTGDPGIGNINLGSLGQVKTGGVTTGTLYEGASTAAQSSTFASNTYLTGSMITLPVGGWAAGGQYHCVFDMAKTTAGTAAWSVNFYIGTLGSISDTLVLTVTSPVLQTAVADTGRFDVYFNVRTTGASATGVGSVSLVRNASTAVGLLASAVQSLAGVGIATTSTFNTTTATKIGIAFNGGSLFSGTVQFVQATYIQ
jgi:hypothetical protein